MKCSESDIEFNCGQQGKLIVLYVRWQVRDKRIASEKTASHVLLLLLLRKSADPHPQPLRRNLTHQRCTAIDIYSIIVLPILDALPFSENVETGRDKHARIDC